MKLLSRVLPVCAFVAAVSASATTITFDDLTFTDYDPVPAGYNDHNASGGTPNIGVQFRTVTNDGTHNQTQPYIELWHSDYADLQNVGFAANNGLLAQVVLTPDPGYSVVLSQFDLGGYSHSTQSQQIVRILDGSSNTILDYSPFDIPGSTHATLSPGLSSTGPLTIEFGPSWNGGIDNIVFRQVLADVPGAVPDGGATAALLSIGALTMAAVASRKK